MKIGLTLIAIALSGLLTGLAFATPLMLSELDVKPYIRHVQGPTAEFEVETIFANFTVLDPDDPASGVDELSVKYQLWVNVTNPSNENAALLYAFFTAAKEITPFSDVPSYFVENSFSAFGGTVEGAFVDGKWYNLTLTTGKYPFFDEHGNMHPPFFGSPDDPKYWIEGVELKRLYVNGSLYEVYMNMNGTWTDVTGRIELDESEELFDHLFGGFAVEQGGGLVIEQKRFFQPYQAMPDVSVEPSTGGYLDPTLYVPIGEGYFDNSFEAGKSRIILIEGVRKRDSDWGNNKPIDVLNSGNIDINVQTLNVVDVDVVIENNTVNDTRSETSELKNVELTKVNNSYIYNIDLLEEYDFTVDEWKAEVFLEAR
jgi:hypothetical protein